MSSQNESPSVASRLVAATLAGAMGAGCAAHGSGTARIDLDGLDADEGGAASDADLRHAGFVSLGNDVNNVRCEISEDRRNALCEAPMGEDVRVGVQCPAGWEIAGHGAGVEKRGAANYAQRRIRVAPGSRGRHELLARVANPDGKEDRVFCARAGTADSIRLALKTRPRDPDQPWVQVKRVGDHGEWVGDAGAAIASVGLPEHGGTGKAAFLDGGATWHHVNGATGGVAPFAPRLGVTALLGTVPLDGVQIVDPKTREVIDDRTGTHRLGVVTAGPGAVLTFAQRAVEAVLTGEAGVNMLDRSRDRGFTALGRLGFNVRFGERSDRLSDGSKTAPRGGVGVQAVAFGGVSSGRPFAGAGVGGRF